MTANSATMAPGSVIYPSGITEVNSFIHEFGNATMTSLPGGGGPRLPLQQTIHPILAIDSSYETLQ